MNRLAVALLAMSPLVVIAQQVSSGDTGIDATLTRMQSLLHHAVETTAEGALLVSLSRTGEATSIDPLAADRGRAMLAEARRLILDVAAGDAMMHLHSLELTDDQNERMIEVHQLEQIATSYLNVTERLLRLDEQAVNDSADRQSQPDQ